MFFGTYKIQRLSTREVDGRHEIIMTQETPQGLHTLVISYPPGDTITENGEVLPSELRIEGYGFVEAAKKFNDPQKT